MKGSNKVKGTADRAWIYTVGTCPETGNQPPDLPKDRIWGAKAKRTCGNPAAEIISKEHRYIDRGDWKMRKEAYQIKRPEHLVIGDPWYFEKAGPKRLKDLVIDVQPQEGFSAALSIQETEYNECMTNIIFASKDEIETYLDGRMYKGQEETVKMLPVDTARYFIEADGRSAMIYTHEDAYWGQQLTLYSGEKDGKCLDAYVITISTPEDMTFEDVKQIMGTVFEDMKLIPEKEKEIQKDPKEPKR